ncbi:MAG: DNA polymerase [Oscillospiraceae bacterium]|nr:DNA polymerase [Oscillospiraceae bacterium]
MLILSIDIETYSSVDLKKSGLYKYVESPDFEITLFAYSLNGGAVRIVDLKQGEVLPGWVVDSLGSCHYTKRARNAVFEWVCLTKFFGTGFPIDQWTCSMIHSMYLGLPSSLEATGKALGLPSDKQKLRSSNELIKYFCAPCKPTKTNGGRTRNLPHHHPERWELFKEYCKQDVVAEMAIADKLRAFPLPAEIQEQWEMDVIINSRGVSVDMDLVQSALEIAETESTSLKHEAEKLTGLVNPNSVAALKDWLNAEIDNEEDKITSITKETVSSLLGTGGLNPTVQRMLEIRRELGKTSTKKYVALANSVCADGRVRGLLQFYGANRTGRWAGRMVQVQNLPRTYLEPLDFARNLAKSQEIEALRLCYGSVQDTLSQLIRTAFVAGGNAILIDADFAAIEARVLAWLSGEQWRLDVFKTHGKIYEASASQMFSVPIDKIVKGNPEYELRQKGKVAELALGYGGSSNALTAMGALQMGLTEEELPDIVSRWRNSNRRICDYWYACENAAISVVEKGGTVGVGNVIFSREYSQCGGLDFMTIALPSGRKLFYANPILGSNSWGKAQVEYMGVDQTKKTWGRISTYGGKLVENITQAVARDCLARAIGRLENNGFRIIMHIHDEIVIEDAGFIAGYSLEKVIKIMSLPMPWGAGLPLAADGWVGKYFKKD